jgi:hypothetical protein
MTDQNNAAPDLGTSSGGRAYIADYFATNLRRHDFAKYINSTLAADFACALAQHLSNMRAEGVQAGANVRPAIGYIAQGCEVALPECRSAKENTSSTIMAQPEGIHTVPVFAEPVACAPVAGNARPDIMSLSGILAEYRKGCSNTGGEGAEHCPDCVRAFVSALEALNVRQASAAVAEPYDSEKRCRAYYESDLRPFAADGVTYDVWKAVLHAAQFDRAMHPNSSKPRPHSAPVVGEAVYTLRVTGAIQAWTPTAAAFSIPDGEHQLFLSPAAPQASAEPLARYCPGCGSVGPVGDEYRDCCPDGNQARMIPARLPEQCRDTFRLAIQPLLADAAANDGAAPQASEAVRIPFPVHLRKMWSGGEVQVWLDAHRGITPPKPSAKGSLERYRKWQAEKAQADKDGGDGAKGAGDGHA